MLIILKLERLWSSPSDVWSFQWLHYYGMSRLSGGWGQLSARETLSPFGCFAVSLTVVSALIVLFQDFPKPRKESCYMRRFLAEVMDRQG